MKRKLKINSSPLFTTLTDMYWNFNNICIKPSDE